MIHCIDVHDPSSKLTNLCWICILTNVVQQVPICKSSKCCAVVCATCFVIEQSINEVVITVPSYFNQAERRAMSRAADAAGLRLLQLINDNTAGDDLTTVSLSRMCCLFLCSEKSSCTDRRVAAVTCSPRGLLQTNITKMQHLCW